MTTDKNKPIWQLTVAELESIIERKINNTTVDTTTIIDASKKEYVYGIDGLANLLGCSTPQAQRFKSRGIFDDAIFQNGRTIIIEKEKALKLFNEKK